MHRRYLLLRSIPRELQESLSQREDYPKINRTDYKYGQAPFVFDIDSELFKNHEAALQASPFWAERQFHVQVSGKDILKYPFYHLWAKSDRNKNAPVPMLEQYGDPDALTQDFTGAGYIQDWQQQPLQIPEKLPKADIFRHDCVGTDQVSSSLIYVTDALKQLMEAEAFTGIDYRPCSREGFYQLVPTACVLRGGRQGRELPMTYVEDCCLRFAPDDLQLLDFQETATWVQDEGRHIQIIISSRVMKFLRDQKVKGLDPGWPAVILPKGVKFENPVVYLTDDKII